MQRQLHQAWIPSTRRKCQLSPTHRTLGNKCNLEFRDLFLVELIEQPDPIQVLGLFNYCYDMHIISITLITLFIIRHKITSQREIHGHLTYLRWTTGHLDFLGRNNKLTF